MISPALVSSERIGIPHSANLCRRLVSRDHAFIDLAGTAQVKENFFNANLFWMPLENLAILTGFRYTHENNDSDSTFLAEEPVPNTPPFTPTNPRARIPLRTSSTSRGRAQPDYNLFAQRLELRYTGIKDWVFYAEGEWEEEYGHVDEYQNIDEDVPLDKNTNALGQKYTIGADLVSDDEIKSVPGSTFTELLPIMKILSPLLSQD